MSAPYHMILLRYWATPNVSTTTGAEAETEQWHFVLIDPESGERIGFSSFASLVAHLQAMITEATWASQNAQVDDGYP